MEDLTTLEKQNEQINKKIDNLIKKRKANLEKINKEKKQIYEKNTQMILDCLFNEIFLFSTEELNKNLPKEEIQKRIKKSFIVKNENKTQEAQEIKENKETFNSSYSSYQSTIQENKTDFSNKNYDI